MDLVKEGIKWTMRHSLHLFFFFFVTNSRAQQAAVQVIIITKASFLSFSSFLWLEKKIEKQPQVQAAFDDNMNNSFTVEFINL